MTEENTTPITAPTTPTAPEWQSIAPSFKSETELANSWKQTKSALTQAQQELATLKAQKPAEPASPVQNVSWDFSDPGTYFDPDSGFKEDFVTNLSKSANIPPEVVQSFGKDIAMARQILANQNKTELDKFAGFDNSLDTLSKYLQETYKGKDLQDRMDALKHPTYWKPMAKDILGEMKDKEWSPTKTDGEPSALPETTPVFANRTPLDPNSNEAVRMISDPRYGYDKAYQKDVADRIALWEKTMRKR